MTIYRLYRRFKKRQDAIVIAASILAAIAAYGVVQQADEAAARVEVHASR